MRLPIGYLIRNLPLLSSSTHLISSILLASTAARAQVQVEQLEDNYRSCNATTELAKLTFYGYPDNTPPGPGIRCRNLDSRSDCTTCATNTNRVFAADECGPRGMVAGGTGTYDDPVTFASAGVYFCFQERIYLPYLQKYLRYEDFCQTCTDDAEENLFHIDIWTGRTDINGGDVQIACERNLTPQYHAMQEIYRNPADDLPVNLTPLFEPGNDTHGLCNGTVIMAASGSAKIFLPTCGISMLVMVLLWFHMLY